MLPNIVLTFQPFESVGPIALGLVPDLDRLRATFPDARVKADTIVIGDTEVIISIDDTGLVEMVTVYANAKVSVHGNQILGIAENTFLRQLALSGVAVQFEDDWWGANDGSFAVFIDEDDDTVSRFTAYSRAYFAKLQEIRANG